MCPDRMHTVKVLPVGKEITVTAVNPLLARRPGTPGTVARHGAKFWPGIT